MRLFTSSYEKTTAVGESVSGSTLHSLGTVLLESVLVAVIHAMSTACTLWRRLCWDFVPSLLVVLFVARVCLLCLTDCLLGLAGFACLL